MMQTNNTLDTPDYFKIGKEGDDFYLTIFGRDNVETIYGTCRQVLMAAYRMEDRINDLKKGNRLLEYFGNTK